MKEAQTSKVSSDTLLSSLKTGQKGIIQSIEINSFSKRLQDLGFSKGSIVECRQKAPFGGPVEYEVRGSRFCLRREDSRLIHIALQATARA